MQCEICGQEAEGSVAEDESEEEEGEIRCFKDDKVEAGQAVEKFCADKGVKPMRRLVDPRRPTQAEVDLHELMNHCPYRNWCPHCIKGQGKNLDHRKAVEEERGLSEYSFDYCLPGDEFGYKLTVLIGRERVRGMAMSTVVPTKGTNGVFELDAVLEFMRSCGDENTDVIIKNDQEPAIQYLIKAIVAARAEGRTHMEESPVGSSGSNGIVEREAQSIEGKLRTMLSALEGRLGCKIDAKEKVVVFMAEHAAYAQNRLEVGADGTTAYERTKGKSAKVLGLGFGEKLLWKVRPKSGKLEKLKSRWSLCWRETEEWRTLDIDTERCGQGKVRKEDPIRGQMVQGYSQVGQACAMESWQ